MFHLNDNFKRVLSPAEWRNKVSAFLNNICGDGYIEVDRPDNPSPSNPPCIKISEDKLRKFVNDTVPKTTYPFQLRVSFKKGETTAVVDYVQMYLPDRTKAVLTDEGKWAYVSTNTVKDNDGGWWTVYANSTTAKFTSGDFWLVQGKDTNGNAYYYFATARSNAAHSIYIGSIGTDGALVQGVAGVDCYHGIGEATGTSADNTIAVKAVPASGATTATELWKRGGTNGTKNPVLNVFAAFTETTDHQPYKTVLYPVQLKFDRDGRLVSITSNNANKVELLDYWHYGDNPHPQE